MNNSTYRKLYRELELIGKGAFGNFIYFNRRFGYFGIGSPGPLEPLYCKEDTTLLVGSQGTVRSAFRGSIVEKVITPEYC